ncbi:Astra associated protein 1 Asa1 [Thecaphora frezii]
MPCPFWVLRHHSPSPVHHLCVDSHRHLVIAGDAQGRVSVTHLRHYRPIAFWQAHTESILGVHLSQNLALTHGRDNRLVLWRLPRRDEDQEGGEHGHNAQHVKGQERIVGDAPPSSIMPTRLSSSLETPALLKEIEVNALNFARFSLLATPLDAAQLPKLAAAECLVAVPHTLDAAWFDVFDLPSGRRVHEAVSKPDIVAKPGSRQPIIMSLHLIRLPTQTGEDLACVAGYEDGYVRLWQHSEARTWTLTWERRVHSESGEYRILRTRGHSILGIRPLTL